MSERRKVLLGVSGSVAAFKAAQLASSLVQEGMDVRVVMTEGATHFVAPLTFEALCNHPVAVEIWDEQAGSSRMGHLELAGWAQLFVIAPVSADTLARLAIGRSDDMLAAVALASRAPLILAPAMETAMWEHPATEEHVETLRQRGAIIVGPQSGRLASGAVGLGRMSDVSEIMESIDKALSRRSDFAGTKFLVTAGPTHEAIDPVRFIGNRSSGKMGLAVAEAARDRGANVLLISGPTDVREPYGVDLIRVEDSEQMGAEVDRHVSGQDVVIMAAAVSDFRVASRSTSKLKRANAISLELEPTDDVAAAAKRQAPDALHITFAVESEDLVEGARRKLLSKGSDLVVANAISKEHNPFGSDNNRVSFVSAEKVDALPEMSKREVADELMDEIAERLKSRRQRTQS